MPTPTQLKSVSQAIRAIRNAEDLLTDQIQATDDTLTCIKLTHEYNNLDSYLSELLHAQNAADDATFTNATKALRDRTEGLRADEEKMKKIIADVATAAKIVGYITQAIGFIARL